MTRPATYTCLWCGTEKELKRTGRMPKWCSDYCRRQPAAAQTGLEQARWQVDYGTRQVAYYEGKLDEYLQRLRDAGDAETNPAAIAAGNGAAA